MGGRTAPLEGLIFLHPLSWIKKKQDIFTICCIRRKYGPDYFCLIGSTPYSNVNIVEQRFVYYSGVTCW